MSEILYLAPLQGFTDVVYRNVFSRHFTGFDLAISPFVSALPGGRVKNREIKDVYPENNPLMPVIPQIMGNRADDFILVANRLYDMGYETVNWNLGCPYKMVANKKRGSGLLCHPDLLEELLEKIVPSIKSRLSVKVRLGRHSKDEIDALIPLFNRFPLEEVIIHPRTGIQMYEGTVDLDRFEEAVPMIRHRVVYNGDINDVETFKRLSGRFENIDRWMIGRGVLMNPFLPAMVRGDMPDPDRVTPTLRAYHDDYFETRLEYLQGPAHIVNNLKSFWTYFKFAFKNGEKIFKKIKKVQTPERYRELVNGFFDSDGESRVL